MYIETIIDLLAECRTIKSKLDTKLMNVTNSLEYGNGLHYFGDKDKIKMERELEETIQSLRNTNKHLNKIIESTKKYNIVNNTPTTIHAMSPMNTINPNANTINTNTTIVRINTEPVNASAKVISQHDQLKTDRIKKLSQPENWNIQYLKPLTGAVISNGSGISGDDFDEYDSGQNSPNNDNENDTDVLSDVPTDVPSKELMNINQSNLLRAKSHQNWQLHELKKQQNDIKKQINHLMTQNNNNDDVNTQQ